jgi:putative membrane protein
MRTNPIPVLTATLVLSLGLAGCGRKDPDVPPPKPAETRTLPAPAVPESAPPASSTSAPGGTLPAPTTPPGAAPSGSAATEAPAGPVAGADRSFVAEAAASGLAEAEAGKLGAEKAADAKVKAFAEHMQTDHADANAKLARIASSKGITLPSAAEGPARAQLDELAKLSGPEFDRAFLQHFGASKHQEAVQVFERQAKEGQDPDLRAFAEQSLDALRKHLQMAQQLDQERK